MAFDDTPSKLQTVFIQRDETNEFYEQVNISGSDLIFYNDESGKLTADRIAVWAIKYGIGGGASAVSSSWSSRSLWASFSTQSVYATESLHSFQSSFTTQSVFATHSSFATQSLFATESLTSSYSYFNGNRKITRGPYSGINLGTDNVINFLNAFFFPFVGATISINSSTVYYETGSSQNITIVGSITANTETNFGTGSIKRSGISWQTFPSASTYSVIDTGVTINRTYQAFFQVGNNGIPSIISSATKNVTFLYPYLWGMNTTEGLYGINLYNGLTTKTIETQQGQSDSFVGTSTYIYFAFPATYGNLTSIKDPNNFEVLSSFQFSASVPVTSSGLTNNWSALYKVYRLTLQANPNGTYTFTH